jgi:serine/threonine protein kinase
MPVAKSAKRLTPPRKPRIEEGWKRSFSFYDAATVGHGSSSTVLEIDEKWVIKVFAEDEDGIQDLERERAIYEKLQKHGDPDCIVTFVEEWEFGLVLERLSSTLRCRLRKMQQPTECYLADQWTREVCGGLAFLHGNGIMQGDIGCHNILIDNSGHVKLCDFAGSKMEDEKAWICYEVRSQHPDYRGEQPTLLTEIFALGSCIFEIYTTRPPYVFESDAVVRQKYQKRDFPLSSIDQPKMRRIVENCWLGLYLEVSSISKDLKYAKKGFQAADVRLRGKE